MDIMDIIKESRTEAGMGSKEGREKAKRVGRQGKSKTTAHKSRVKVYDTIKDALKRGYIGQIFSTKGSGRLYVITHQKWGQDQEHIVGGRTAKGFSPGSIPSSFKDVKGYAVRTMSRYGKSNPKRFKSGEFWKSRRKEK